MKRKLFAFLLSASFGFRAESDSFSFLTDLSWPCFFPLHFEGRNLTPEHRDFVQYKKRAWYKPFCICKKEKIIGLPVAFWEPQAIVEVTRVPYKFMTFIPTEGRSESYGRRGGIANSDAGRTSFYNVHYFAYPLARIAMVIPGFTCLRNKEISIPFFLSEFFPFWNDPSSKWHWLLDPVRFLYKSPDLQAQCQQDCDRARKRMPTNAYPWCAGCLGPLYPFCGHVAHHIGGVQASSLLLCRMIGLIHSASDFLPKGWGIGAGFKTENFCHKTRSRTLKKTYYKTQMIYPRPDKGSHNAYAGGGEGKIYYCHPLGESDSTWSQGHIFPQNGEDFAYVVWTKMHCCVDLLDVVKTPLASLFGKTSEKAKKKRAKLEEFQRRGEERLKELETAP